MIQKWAVGLLILFIGFVFFYQTHYLKTLKIQSKLKWQSNQQNTKLIVAEVFDFKTFFYDKNGLLKTKFSGDKFLYYQDGSFRAEGNLIYENYDSFLKSIAVIQTEEGIGEFESLQTKNDSILSQNTPLKWLKLPGNVTFNLNENKGTTKNVLIDAINRTISSREHIESHGPDGSISADGFFYDIDNKEFTLNSSVRGTYKPQPQDRK